MERYKSIYKEAGEYDDTETRQFISNIVDMNFTAKKIGQAIASVIWVEGSESNPEFSRSGNIPRTSFLDDLSDYLYKNQLNKINRRLLYNAWLELDRIESFYEENDLDATDIREELGYVEKAFQGIF